CAFYTPGALHHANKRIAERHTARAVETDMIGHTLDQPHPKPVLVGAQLDGIAPRVADAKSALGGYVSRDVSHRSVLRTPEQSSAIPKRPGLRSSAATPAIAPATRR